MQAVLYLLAGLTGLRKKELLNLYLVEINLSSDNASVKVKTSIAKNGKEAERPVPPIVVNLLAALKARVGPSENDRVFLVLWQMD